MSISFPSLSDAIRVPFIYAEFDPTGASEDPAQMPYTVLLVGQKRASGSAEAGSVTRPMSKKMADDLFGQGSQMSAMVTAYLEANSLTKMLAIAVDDAPEGVVAEGAVVLSGTVTSAAPLCLYIGGVLVRAAASYNSTAASVAEKLATAINANPDLPVTATFSAGQVTLRAKHAGECGDAIDLRLSYYGELVPGGLSITLVPLSGGAGNPDAAPVIAAMGNTQFHLIAWPWTDAASLALLRDELDDRWGPLRQIDGQAVVVKRGTFGEVTTFSEQRNDRGLTVFASEGSPTSPWVDCASTVGVIAYYANTDPARGFRTLTLPGVLAPAEADRWPNFPEKNQGLYGGLSTRYAAPDGTLRLEKVITTYRMNALGAEDKAYLSLNSPLTLSYLRYDWRNILLLKYPRHKLADDADIKYYNSTQPIMTPKQGKSEAIARFQVWLEMGLVEGFEQFKKELVVERNAKNEQRLDWLLRPNLMNQFEVGGVLFRHLV